MDLTKKDRLIIANQLKILEKLYPEEADHYAKQRKAIEEGYKFHYSWLVEHIFDNEMSEEECTEVLEILDMHRGLIWSYQDIIDKAGIEEQTIRFRGFDGNLETRQFGYTHYFILDLGRFDELRYGEEYPDFNSHCPMLDKYRRMFGIWNAYEEESKFKLSKEQIEKILKA